MTVATIFPSFDGYLSSQDSTIPGNAMAGTGDSGISVQTSGTTTQLNVGAAYPTPMTCYQMFLEFDTSSIPVGAIVSGVSLGLYGVNDASTIDFLIEVSAFDFGASLTSADWRDRTQGSALAAANLGSMNTSAWVTSAYNVIFLTNAAPVLGGTTRFILQSSRVYGGSSSFGSEYVVASSSSVVGTSQDPYLQVTYTLPSGLQMVV